MLTFYFTFASRFTSIPTSPVKSFKWSRKRFPVSPTRMVSPRRAELPTILHNIAQFPARSHGYHHPASGRTWPSERTLVPASTRQRAFSSSSSREFNRRSVRRFDSRDPTTIQRVSVFRLEARSPELIASAVNEAARTCPPVSHRVYFQTTNDRQERDPRGALFKSTMSHFIRAAREMRSQWDRMSSSRKRALARRFFRVCSRFARFAKPLENVTRSVTSPM